MIKHLGAAFMSRIIFAFVFVFCSATAWADDRQVCDSVGGGDPNQTIEACTPYLAGLPRTSEKATALFHRAQGKHSLHDLDGTLDDLNQAIEINSDDFRPFALRSELWRIGGLYNKCIADASSALRLIPEGKQAVEVYQSRASCYAFSDQIDAALLDYQKAIELKPNDASSLAEYGLRLGQYGEKAKGESYVDRAIQIDPKDTANYESGIMIERGAGDSKKMKDYVDRLIKSHTTIKVFQYDILYYRGIYHNLRGENNAALMDLLAAWRAPSPMKRPHVLYELVKTYGRLGRFKDALAVASDGENAGETNDYVKSAVALVLSKMGKYQESISILDKLLKETRAL